MTSKLLVIKPSSRAKYNGSVTVTKHGENTPSIPSVLSSRNEVQKKAIHASVDTQVSWTERSSTIDALTTKL